MIKKYLGLSLLSASMLVMGCSSDDDSNDGDANGGGAMLVTVPATVTLPEGVEPTLNITELAVNTPDLAQLVAAVTRANLGDTLADTDSGFTVFAPTDAAFAALPEGTVDGLSDEALTDLLQYHVVSGALNAEGVIAGVGMEVATLNGRNLAIGSDATDPEAVVYTIGGANIVGTDIYATNGIVHLIDTVLIPPVEPIADADSDTIADADDNCPSVANPD